MMRWLDFWLQSTSLYINAYMVIIDTIFTIPNIHSYHFFLHTLCIRLKTLKLRDKLIFILFLVFCFFWMNWARNEHFSVHDFVKAFNLKMFNNSKLMRRHFFFFYFNHFYLFIFIFIFGRLTQCNMGHEDMMKINT